MAPSISCSRWFLLLISVLFSAHLSSGQSCSNITIAYNTLSCVNNQAFTIKILNQTNQNVYGVLFDSGLACSNQKLSVKFVSCVAKAGAQCKPKQVLRGLKTNRAFPLLVENLCNATQPGLNPPCFSNHSEAFNLCVEQKLFISSKGKPISDKEIVCRGAVFGVECAKTEMAACGRETMNAIVKTAKGSAGPECNDSSYVLPSWTILLVTCLFAVTPSVLSQGR